MKKKRTRTVTTLESWEWFTENFRFECYLILDESGCLRKRFRLKVEDLHEDELNLLMSAIQNREVPVTLLPLQGPIKCDDLIFIPISEQVN